MGEIERRIVALGDDRDHDVTYWAMEAVRVLTAAAGAHEPGPDWEDMLAEWLWIWASGSDRSGGRPQPSA